MEKISYSLLIILLFSTHILAQKYTTGTIEIGLVDLKMSDDSVDSSTILMIKESIEREMAMTISFNEDRVVVEKKDLFNEVTRVVLDMESNQMYEFKTLSDEPVFTVEALESNTTDTDKKTALESFDKISNTSLTIMGLECQKYTKGEEGKEMTFLLTKDITYHDVLNLSPFPKEQGTLVHMIVDEPASGMTMTIGMKSFVASIADPTIFSIDTIGLANIGALRNAFLEGLELAAEDSSQQLSKYGEYRPDSINKDIIQKLVDLGGFQQDEWSIKTALEGGTNYDIPSILLLAKYTQKGLPSMDRSQTKTLLAKAGLLTPTVDQLLNLDENSWNKISSENRYSAICIASIKDHLDNTDTRQQIVNNLETLSLGYFADNSVAQSYLDGNATLADLIGEVDGLTRLDTGIATDNTDIYNYIKSFFEIALGKKAMEFSKSDNLVNIHVGDQKYIIDINLLKEEDYDNSNYDIEPAVIAYYDTVAINKYFYDNLLTKIKQIGADTDAGLAYGIYDLVTPIAYQVGKYAYSEIVNSLPFLAPTEDAIYFQQFAKDDYSFDANVGAGFPYHPEAYHSEINIGNFRVGDIDAGVDFITSSQKKEFIDYLTQNYQSFNINKQTLDESISDIKSSLLAGSEELLQYLPNIKITVNNVFEFTPKSEYYPSFAEGRNDFKNAYYALHNVLQDDFIASNFRYDSENHDVLFTYEGKEYTVKPGDKSMLHFIRERVKKSDSGKQFFPVISWSTTTAEYYYMTPEQKAALSKLVPIEF